MEQRGPSKVELKEWLRPVQDPELRVSLLDLGLIYDVSIEGSKVDVDMTLTSPGCPMVEELVQSVKDRFYHHPEVTEVEVKIVWEPKWDPAQMASEEAKEQLGIW